MKVWHLMLFCLLSGFAIAFSYFAGHAIGRGDGMRHARLEENRYCDLQLKNMRMTRTCFDKKMLPHYTTTAEGHLRVSECSEPPKYPYMMTYDTYYGRTGYEFKISLSEDDGKTWRRP